MVLVVDNGIAEILQVKQCRALYDYGNAKRCDGMPPADPEQPTVDWRSAAAAIRRLLDLSGYGLCG